MYLYASLYAPPLAIAYSQVSPYSVPLGIAALNGHIEIVEELLIGGANINYQDKVRSAFCVQCMVQSSSCSLSFMHSVAIQHYTGHPILATWK